MTDLLAVQQVAERLGQTAKWVHRQAYEKKIAYQKFGRVKMFRPQDIETYLERTRVEAKWSTDAKTPPDGGSEESKIPSLASGPKSGLTLPKKETRRLSKRDFGLIS